jgi:hypothetical protein
MKRLFASLPLLIKESLVLDNVKQLPVKATSADLALIQLGKEIGKDLEAFAMVLKIKGAKTMAVSLFMPKGMDAAGFLSKVALMFPDVALQGIAGHFDQGEEEDGSGNSDSAKEENEDVELQAKRSASVSTIGGDFTGMGPGFEG